MIIPLFQGATRRTLKNECIELLTGFLATPLSDESIDFRHGVFQLIWFTADSLIPVEDGCIVELLLHLIGCTRSIGIGTVGKQKYNAIEFVEGIPLTAQLLKGMRQSQVGLEMIRLDGKERFVIDARQVVMMELGLTERTEIECRQITIVETEHITILLNGVFPLMEIDIRLGFFQTKVCILRILVDGLDEDRYRVTPLLLRLCPCTDHSQQ